MTLPANTSYLLEHAGLRRDGAPPQDVLILGARPIRSLVRRWWLELDPEHTAGVSVELMEDSLIKLAETLVRMPRQRIGRYQALQVVTRKLVSIHGKAELLIAERFLDGSARLGVLVGESSISFAHPSLLELYLGLAYQRATAWPTQLRRVSLFSLEPLNHPWGRAVWARLTFTEPELLEEAFDYVAGLNLHLATWFLYCNAEARARFGEAYAGNVLALAHWGASSAEQQVLDQLLASLGDCSVPAARACLFEQQAVLPAVWLAARIVGRLGSPDDAMRLAALASDPALGAWEIDRMRQALREAQSLTLDAETLKQYRNEELVEFGKDALRVLAMIGGALLFAQLKMNHSMPGVQLSREGAEAGAHSLMHVTTHMAGELAKGGPNEVLMLQRTLRERLAFLPAEIERRKVDIERTRPYVQQEIQRAVDALTARSSPDSAPKPA